MEETTETTPSYSLQDQATTERGAGGKLRRQPPRRPPTTPYARPQQNQSLRGRLLSKLVDPACRLIASGASRILPSLFLKPLNNDSLPPPEPQAHVLLETGELDEDIEEHTNEEDQSCYSTVRVSIFAINVLVVSETAGTIRTTDGPKAGSGIAEHRKGNQGDIRDDGLSEIEKLMKGKTFSRDEINRLIGIINSKAVDVPQVDQEDRNLTLSTGGAKGPIVSQNLRWPTEEKQDDLNIATTTRDLATPLPKPTYPKQWIELKLGVAFVRVQLEFDRWPF
ncbi:hypothetical protein Goarm_004574 [Gossypium armourianum]|uniref:Uncharacterized protein n=1 Tax=Gossypium armourianum TaxID=34283 RepID=A0A7J9JX62_9ROSI|nr:hypothetical protein [Gossypium armourianum]